MQTEWQQRLRLASAAIKPPQRFQSYGRLLSINGLTLTVKGGRLSLGQRCQVEGGQQWFDAEVIGFDQEQAFLMPLAAVSGLYAGAKVRVTENSDQLPVGESLMGRVVDGLMRPIDGLGEIDAPRQTLYAPHLSPMQRRGVEQPLDVGIRALNGLFTVGKGQRIGLFAGSGVGKSKLLGMMTRYTAADVVIVGLIGERGWEVRDFIEHALGPEGRKKAIVVAAPADQSPLLRLRSAELSHKLAAYFREQGKNVLLLMDSLTRYAQAQREIGLSLGEPPATKGYPPSVFSKLTSLVESSGNSNSSRGSMTAIYTVLAEGDDPQDPIVDSTRAILDGHIVLRRSLAEQGHFPAIDIGASISRVMPQIVSEAHLQACYRLKRLYSRYQQVQELIPLGAYQKGEDAELDAVVKRFPAIEAFLCQGLNEQSVYADSHHQLMELMREFA
ncbi:FliI/YscN family ATPase [Shewanella sp. A32]|uniref:FliI/YscN family ATPase n=1 Tax=Shewanella sp. A32 TaxID=3031327 RepID=UPI0023B93BE0|nr:FliI/YscN family ATPase [Shewanella sp. A32]MDF0535708.1 FliI/YscN family ATPase [Shewanella sp. A32]